MALAVVAALARGGSGKGAAAAGGGGAANGLMGFAAVLCLLDLRLPHRTVRRLNFIICCIHL